MTRTILIGLVVSIAALGVGTAGQGTTGDEFQDWLTARKGRWIGDVTWIADWPGLGKRGEKVTGYFEVQVVADGRVGLGIFYGGSGTNRWITSYDAASRQIRQTFADSGGTTNRCVVTKKAMTWVSACSGSLADGTLTEGEYTSTISDGGNTHTVTGTTLIGGKEVDKLHDVWRRVSK